MAAPTTIGKYEILSTLGRGGMGVVYRAQDPRMGRQVAIKTVTEGLSNDQGMLQRFYREAEKMGMLKHPNIITVYDLGEQDGYPYIVMEFVEGEPLDQIIQSNRQVPLIYKLRIIEQVCSALGYAHHSDVVHRDVKPANVIVRPDGVAKLLDFGIARQEKNDVDHSLTATGGVIGTVPYMAPERLKGAALDGRSDIFAAGVLLYQFLTGKLPFSGEELVLVNQLLNDKHPPLNQHLHDYPAALDMIVQRSLEKDPADRYQTAEEMGTDLYSVIESLKKDYAGQLIVHAERLTEGADFVGARDALVELLKLDNQHTQARRLLADVNLRLTRKVRMEQAQERRRQADDALHDKNYDQAIHLLEEAVKLVPDDVEIAGQLETARARKQTNDQIMGYLRQADMAKRSGDYAGAQAIVEKAIKLDTNNSRLRAAYQALIRQAEEAAQQAKIKTLLDAAKDVLRQRNYAKVLELVHEAELLDAANSELPDLTAAAREGLFQEERRGVLEEIEGQLSGAVTEEDVMRVASLIRDAQEKTPSDATLLRYQAQTDRRLREHESRRLVDETVKQCRATMDATPSQALDMVRQTLLQVPGDERLIALEASIQDRMARRSAEEMRSAILLQAREALVQRRFAEAAAILDQCQGTVRTKEITELLEYALQESQHEQQQALVARSFHDAQTLARDGRHEEVVALLGPILQASDDTRLRPIFEQSLTVVEQQRADQEAALQAVQPYAEAHCYEQAVAVILALPAGIGGLAEMQTLRVAAQEAWRHEWTGLESLGQAYASLESGDADRLATAGTQASDTAVLRGMRKGFIDRRTGTIDQILAAQIQRIQTAKATGAETDRPEDFFANRKIAPFASDATRAEWSRMTEQNISGKKTDGLLSKLGRRGR
jgi:eukaryotic-like serine/threonine-protein kinase